MKRIIIEKINKVNGRRDKIIIPSDNPEKYLLENKFQKIEGPHWTQYEREDEKLREVAIIQEEE